MAGCVKSAAGSRHIADVWAHVFLTSRDHMIDQSMVDMCSLLYDKKRVEFAQSSFCFSVLFFFRDAYVFTT